jgi:hypothetical protein
MNMQEISVILPAFGGFFLLFLKETGKAFLLYSLGFLFLAIASVLPDILYSALHFGQ